MRSETFRRFTASLITASGLFFAAASTPVLCAQETPTFTQDITLHETTRTSGAGSGDRSVTTTNFFSRNAMKRTAPDGNDTIIRVGEGKIITLDHAKKTYSIVSVKELSQVLEKTAAEEGENNKEQVEAMRKMMGAMMNSFKVTKIGPGEEIAGYRTEKYAVQGMVEMEIWAAPDLKVPELYYEALKMSVPASAIMDVRKLYDEFKKIDGMTLKTVTTMKMLDMDVKTETVVTSVEKTPIPASFFTVPEGYKQVPSEMLR
jgi:hypothetical protein